MTGVNVTAPGADPLTVVGHKVGRVKAIAAYVRAALEQVIYGRGQECGRRAGTENVALRRGHW